MNRFAMVMALCPTLAASQEAPVEWDCLTEDGRAFRVELWQPSELGVVHCVTGLDLGGVAGCAPQGGWGLSDPEAAPGELSGVGRTAEAIGAEGKFFARVGLSDFVASASRGLGRPLGLSDPEGAPGELSGVGRTAGAIGAEGKFFARVGLSDFVASASRGLGRPLVLEVHGVTFWRMRMDLASGEGEMFARDGTVAFRCGGIEAGP